MKHQILPNNTDNPSSPKGVFSVGLDSFTLTNLPLTSRGDNGINVPKGRKSSIRYISSVVIATGGGLEPGAIVFNGLADGKSSSPLWFSWAAFVAFHDQNSVICGPFKPSLLPDPPPKSSLVSSIRNNPLAAHWRSFCV